MNVKPLFKPDETTSLLSCESGHRDSDNDAQTNDVISSDTESNVSKAQTQQRIPSLTVLKVVLVLLVGTFTANGDGSLVLATHPTIASEFDCLSASSWLFVSFSLAGAATQTLTSNIVIPISEVRQTQRHIRPPAAANHRVYPIRALVGTGNSMGMVIFGRAISGCGGSALNVLGILIITGEGKSTSTSPHHVPCIFRMWITDEKRYPDLVPLREAATWQSGINLAATMGRSLGGPVGGWLADTVGWRWSFTGQVPLFLIAIGLCLAWLPGETSTSTTTTASTTSASTTKLDTEEADEEAATNTTTTTTTTTTTAGNDNADADADDKTKQRPITTTPTPTPGLARIDLGGTELPWTNPLIFALAAATLVLGGLFLATEAWWAADPIFPVALLKHRDVLLVYFVTAAQGGAQLGLMFAVPLYFQVTKRVSNAVAGTYLLPAVAGNAVGAILAGIVIKRTGRYKPLLIFATSASTLSYLLLLLRWHGRTSVWEALYILPGGLGAGIVQTATFIAAQAAIDPAHKAAAMSGNVLLVTIGGMAGMVAVNAVTIETMTRKLGELLSAMGIGEVARQQIIEKAASDIGHIDTVNTDISAAMVEAYVDGLSASHVVSLVGSVSAIIAALLIREHKL
ncbi:Vacuolar membrane amino acid uptake transporter fnx2 [Apiospora phragmitis]|uniref:Vacuolar membrane amino acid uptake transporter fnx2 n=1 Tax=Apiospora phragmitis TaxID=2905665 RepID=A0ABR1T6V1_9PEZI